MAKKEILNDKEPLKNITRKELIRSDNAPKFPPGIAKLMLDLALQKKGIVDIYDPFTGNGTILFTAKINYGDRLGRLYGQDIDPEAVAATQLNLEYVSGNFADFEIKLGNSLISPIPKTQNPLIVITDPPFGRACNWIDETGLVSPCSKIERFLQTLEVAQVDSIVFCYDQKQDLTPIIKRYFRINQTHEIKNRRIYCLRR